MSISRRNARSGSVYRVNVSFRPSVAGTWTLIICCVSACKFGSGAKLMHVEPADGPHLIEFTSGFDTMDLSIARPAAGWRKLQELRVRSIAYCPSAATACINIESEPNLHAETHQGQTVPAVLHHQAKRPGHRARPVHHLRHRDEGRWWHDRGEQRGR